MTALHVKVPCPDAVPAMNVNIIERAFQLAPGCASMSELRRALHKEGHVAVNAHLAGLGTQRALRKLYNGGAGTNRRGPKRQPVEGAPAS